MALPRASEARRFYRVAFQRLDDARFLLNAGRATGAMYLAGYGVECVLKALILSVTSTGATPETLASFRGAKAHDYEWLRFRYRSLGGPDFPPEAAKNFVRVNAWSTSLRYKTGTTKRRDAEDFLKASRAILQWADGRL